MFRRLFLLRIVDELLIIVGMIFIFFIFLIFRLGCKGLGSLVFCGDVVRIVFRSCV